MSKEPKPFTKKQLAIIFKIAFLEAMALSIIVPTIQSSGELPAVIDQPNELTNIQNGTATVSITAGTTQGTTTITYSPTYTSVPRLFVTPHATLEFTTTTAIPNPEAYFQSSQSTTWTNMPATTTELYGDSNGDHRIAVNWANMLSFRFGVTCENPSNTAGAYLTVEYSTDGGVTFTEVNSANRFVIDNTQCPQTGLTNHQYYANINYQSIPSAARTTTTTLRITGTGGGGIGDTPSFSELWIDWSNSANGSSTITVSVTGTWRACGTLALCVASPPVETLKTGFVIAVIFPIAPTVTQTAKFTWKAGIIV